MEVDPENPPSGANGSGALEQKPKKKKKVAKKKPKSEGLSTSDGAQAAKPAATKSSKNAGKKKKTTPANSPGAVSVASKLVDEKAAYKTPAVIEPVPKAAPRKAPPSGLKKQSSKKKSSSTKRSKSSEGAIKAASRTAAAAPVGSAPLEPPSRSAFASSASSVNNMPAEDIPVPTDLNRAVSQPGAFRAAPPMGTTDVADLRRNHEDLEQGGGGGDHSGFDDEPDENLDGARTPEGDYLVTATLVEEDPPERTPSGRTMDRFRMSSRRQSRNINSSKRDSSKKMMVVDAKPLDEYNRNENDSAPRRRLWIILGVVGCLLAFLLGILVAVLFAAGAVGGGGSSSSKSTENVVTPTQAPVITLPPVPVPTPAPSRPPFELTPWAFSPSSPFATDVPPWWDEIGNHPVYFSDELSPTAYLNIFDNIIDTKDRMAVFFVQWGYIIESCEGMKVPPRLEIACNGGQGTVIDDFDVPLGAFCSYQEGSEAGYHTMICGAYREIGEEGWVPGPFDPYPVPYEFGGVFKILCAADNREDGSADELTLVAKSLPFTGDTCGSIEEPSTFSAYTGTGVGVGHFCYTGDGDPTKSENLQFTQGGVCLNEDGGPLETVPLQTADGGILDVCGLLGECEGPTKCDPVADEFLISKTVSSECHILGNQGLERPYNWNEQGMWSIVENSMIIDSFGAVVETALLEEDED